ncbi:hypothetical protein NKH57_18185 [Mesorhizobium sp. M1050]|uniref:hypothetical protein n=1 Tax=Mesorhizobium sp. M1050 TaxID=2957051 RepID=UPI00333D0BD7
MALSSIELLDDARRVDSFDCGKPALNAWLADFARRNQARGFIRVLVIHDEGTVVGYYGLAPGQRERAAGAGRGTLERRESRCR